MECSYKGEMLGTFTEETEGGEGNRANGVTSPKMLQDDENPGQ